MKKKTALLCACVIVSGLVFDTAQAQCAAGGRQGGSGNAFAGNGMRAGRSGLNSANAQMGMLAMLGRNRGMMMPQQSGMMLQQAAVMRSQVQMQQRMNPRQFTMAAMRLDGDGNGALDQAELTQVANAVLAEMRRRNVPAANTTPVRYQSRAASSRGRSDAQPQVNEDALLVQAFVTRSLTFDTNKDGQLNPAETQAMATAFLKSLG